MAGDKTIVKSDALSALMTADGYKLGSGETMIHCFNPHHDDKTPSMSVNRAKGQYKCHGCGISGNAYNYLVIKRGMKEGDAMKLLVEMGWTHEKIEDVKHVEHVKKIKKAGHAFYTDLLFSHPRKEVNNRWIADESFKIAADYKYLDERGKVYMLKRRYENYDDPDNVKKTFTIFTKAKRRKGWYVAGPLDESIPKEDRREKYTLYGIESVLAEENPKRQVYFVEGEKNVDTVREILGKEPSLLEGAPPCVSCCGGTSINFRDHDFLPLRGRKVLCISDADDVGRRYMKSVAEHLYTQYGCKVRIVLLPGESHRDIHDSLVEGGWHEAKRLFDACVPKDYEPESSAGFIETGGAELGGDYFRVLGVKGGEVWYQHKKTAELLSIKKSNIALENHMLELAPMNYWLSISLDKNHNPVPELSRRHKLTIADDIIRQGERLGVFSPTDRAFGRGGVHSNGRFFYNLGKSVLFMNEHKKLTVSMPITEVEVEGVYFTPGGGIDMGDDEPMARTTARKLYECISAYRWESPEDGNAFAGFIVTSIIGGCLEYRPMLWMLAPATTGKSWLLDNVYKRLLGNICYDSGDITEAGVSKYIASDSLAGYIDEFEPRGLPSQDAKYKEILALLRLASTGQSKRTRAIGDPVQPRFSMLLTSIRRPDLSEADQSRFFTVRLSKKPIDHWQKLEKSINETLTPKNALALRTWIIRSAVLIAEKAKDIERELTLSDPKMNTRDKKIVAALTAGVRFLSLNDKINVRRKELDMIEPEEYAPLQDIISKRILIESFEGGNHWATVGECVYNCMKSQDIDKCLSNLELQKYGMKVTNNKNARGDDFQLHFEPKNNELIGLLKGSKYQNASLKDYFYHLDGCQAQQRTYMLGRQVRTCSIGEEVLQQIGFHSAGYDEQSPNATSEKIEKGDIDDDFDDFSEEKEYF